MLPHREYHLTKARQSRLATSAPHETVQGKANKRLPKNKGMNADDQPSHASHVQVPTPKCAISPSASTQRNKTGPIQISLKKRENAPWNALFSALTDVNSTKL